MKTIMEITAYAMINAGEDSAGHYSGACVEFSKSAVLRLNSVNEQFEALAGLTVAWGSDTVAGDSRVGVLWSANKNSTVSYPLYFSDYANDYQLVIPLPSLRWVRDNVEALRNPDPTQVLAKNHQYIVWAQPREVLEERVILKVIDVDSVNDFVTDWMWDNKDFEPIGCSFSEYFTERGYSEDEIEEFSLAEILVTHHIFKQANNPDPHKMLAQIFPAKRVAELRLKGII